MAHYPLEAARAVRAGARERAEQALAGAIQAATRAADDAGLAKEALAVFRRRRRQREARTSPPTSGAALHRQRAFQDHVESRERALVGLLRAAASEERRCAARVREAREALRAACVEEKVVERHHERWAKGEARAAARAEERALEEISGS